MNNIKIRQITLLVMLQIFIIISDVKSFDSIAHFYINKNNFSYSGNKQMGKEKVKKILKSLLLKPILKIIEKLFLLLNWIITKFTSIIIPGSQQPSVEYIISVWGWEPLNDESYNLFVKSGGLRNITVILPIVTYKGKPIEGIVKWIEEMIKEVDANIFKEAKNINVGIINTKYGPMMKIYIPILNENYNQFLETASPDFNSKFIKEKYTKVSPHWLSEEFGITPVVKISKWEYPNGTEGSYRRRYIDTYIYADWEGSNNLYVEIATGVSVPFGLLLPSGGIGYIVVPDQDSEIIKTFGEEGTWSRWYPPDVNIKFKKSGWTKIRLIQSEPIVTQVKDEHE